MGRNTYDGTLARTSDSEWYARTRFRPDFEISPTKGLDLKPPVARLEVGGLLTLNQR